MIFKNEILETSQPVWCRIHHPINFKKFNQTSKVICYQNPNPYGNGMIKEWWYVHNSDQPFLVYVNTQIRDYSGEIWLCKNNQRIFLGKIYDEPTESLVRELIILSKKKLSKKSKMTVAFEGEQYFKTKMLVKDNFIIENLFEEL